MTGKKRSGQDKKKGGLTFFDPFFVTATKRRLQDENDLQDEWVLANCTKKYIS